MKEKDRIIELVKQNVISMEEALDLLEAINEKPESTKLQAEAFIKTTEDTETVESPASDDKNNPDIEVIIDGVIEQGKNWATGISDFFKKSQTSSAPQGEQTQVSDTDAHVEDLESHEADLEKQEIDLEKQERVQEINQEISEINLNLKKLQEGLTICEQRLREIEIFAELDELTPEMEEQQRIHNEKQASLSDKIKEAQDAIDQLHEEKRSLGVSLADDIRNDMKAFINESSETISEKANRFSKEASREGKKLGTFLTEKSKELFNNFNLKDINLNLQVPWLKTVKEDYHFEYTAEGVEELDINILNGSLALEPHDQANIIVDGTVGFHGHHEQISQEYFESVNLIENQGKAFIYHIKNPKISIDASMKVPDKVYQQVKIKLANGDYHLNNCQSEVIHFNNKNGDGEIRNCQAQELTLESLNGDVKIIDSPIETMVLNNLNGDFRIQGPLMNLSADTVNSDFYITKQDETPSHIKIKNINGDVKLSVPNQTDLNIHAKTTTGEILNRLTQLDHQIDAGPKTGKNLHFKRTLGGSRPEIFAEIQCVSSDIYLKDNDSSNEGGE